MTGDLIRDADREIVKIILFYHGETGSVVRIFPITPKSCHRMGFTAPRYA